MLEIEYRFCPIGERDIVDWIRYGGVEFPKYLITAQSMAARFAKSEEILKYVKEELAKGTPGGDAGDAHGQYHNEVAWYREQDLARRSSLAQRIGGNLHLATIVDNYDVVRQVLEQIGARPNVSVTLSSKVSIQYGDDVDDTEKVLLVSPLDGRTNREWVSVETPLAKAIENKSPGQTVSFRTGDNLTTVKILATE